MKKVLLVSHSYPSRWSPNVLCDEMVIKRLLATYEAEVHCLCMRYSGQLTEELVGGVHVHRFRIGPYFELNDRAMRKPGTFAERAMRVSNHLLMRLGQVFTLPIYPCYHPFRVRQYLHEAEELYRRHEFDVVVCEHFGFETMMAGYFLKRRHPEIRYLQFFWDALSGGTRPRYLTKRFIDTRRERVERKVLDTVDLAVAMTSHKEHLMGKSYAVRALADGRLCFRGVPYLQKITAEGHENPLEFDHTKINIVFSGTLWNRTLEYVAAVLSKVRGMDIVFWVITASDTKEFKKRVAGYENMIRFVPFLEHEKLLGVLADADVLLNMGVGNPNAVSGKIMEYMGCCKPIISTYYIDNEACLPILRRYPQSLLLDERDPDIEAAASKVEEFLLLRNEIDVDYRAVEEEFYDCKPDSYCELFNLPLKADDARG